MIEHEDTRPALSRQGCTHQASSSGSDDDGIIVMACFHARIVASGTRDSEYCGLLSQYIIIYLYSECIIMRRQVTPSSGGCPYNHAARLHVPRQESP